MASQEYMLQGRFKYQVLISTFDGWDYKFPVLDPIRLDNITDRVNSQSVPHATGGQWIDVRFVPRQQEGYFGWVPTDDFILHMRPQHSIPNDPFAYVGRFSYEPESQEFLMGRLDQKHAETIQQFGTHVFNRYVRGIYIRDQRLVLIRAYFNPLDEQGVFHDDIEYDPNVDQQKTDQTLEMLIKNNLPQDTKVIIRVSNEVVRRFDQINV
ncbi:MAG: hypothetical protein AABX74_06630 [Nanoarchaeota archaeon]